MAVEDRRVILEALRILTPAQRSALILVEFVGYDPSEVARVMRIQPTTVRSLTSQARSRLRSALGGSP